MKVRVKYESQNEAKAPVAIDVEISDGEWLLMVEKDYEKRKEEASQGETVTRRSAQEIMDEEFNKPLYNNWHREHRRRSAFPVPFHKEGDEENSDGSEWVPDSSDEENRTKKYDYEAACQLIRNAFPQKPEWADAVISVYLDGESIRSYAKRIGTSENNITQKLKRARRKLSEILKNRQI